MIDHRHHTKEATRLPRSFFAKPTLTVAKALLGKIFRYKDFAGMISEVEAYAGHDDPACHGARGKTKRNEVMFGRAGHLYVYFIYGMYHCMNIVTECEDFPSAVLIRGMIPVDTVKYPVRNFNGPGKICKHLRITKLQNGLDLCASKECWIEDRGIKVRKIQKTPRIGIRVGREKLWRFMKDIVS